MVKVCQDMPLSEVVQAFVWGVGKKEIIVVNREKYRMRFAMEL